METEDGTQSTVETDSPAVITVACSVKLEPPTFVSVKKSYESYRRQLKTWMLASCVETKRQALVVALSLPEEDESNIKEKVFSELDTDELIPRMV